MIIYYVASSAAPNKQASKKSTCAPLNYSPKFTDFSRYEAFRSHLFDHGPPVFTHADLGAEHILVNPDEGRIVGIIDWEMAGFWPQYWEYRKALYGYGCLELEGWQDIGDAVMTPYPSECAFDNSIQFF